MSASPFPQVLDTIEFHERQFTLIQVSGRRFVVEFDGFELARCESAPALESAIASGGLVGARGLFASLAEAWLALRPVLISPPSLDSAAILSGTSPLGFEEGNLGDLLTITVGLPSREPFPGWVTLGFVSVLVDRASSTLTRFKKGIIPIRRHGKRILYWMGSTLLYYHQRSVLGAGVFHTGGSRQRFQPRGHPLDLNACVARLFAVPDLLVPGLDPDLVLQVLQARLVVELRKFNLDAT